ncbi:mitochondrial acidic protein MAM33 [Verticillium dahliae VdLs.17]|uniref:Mitochondrial acidic protein MAM33 n=1 Tax=Verticillium dahliae (strain VdLs.17 / ATCC MYA-4575 / FGSC 10137) TaxID=498257 RepID=G2WV26_VERDV|nr:mitochondrial acidic protein MAM33 [Verticillium dahliae VdLs.17]EGY20151.1 mitochondrial acidic protein MAM33 [Verticillium dahliae VdLs.17]
MLSIRSAARSAPRALGRLARQTPVARPNTLFKTSSPLSAALRTQRASAFSTTVFRRAAESDEELAAKLESELQFEEEVKQNEQLPASVKDFLDNSPFELHDSPGKEDVKLTRTFGDEKITITFSIADLANYDPDMYEQDRALEDEDDIDASDVQNANKQANVPATGGARSAQAEEDLEAEEEEDLDDDAAPPTRLSIVVEKPGRSPGALNIDAVAQDGSIVVENMFYYEDAALATPTTPEGAQKKADVYPGAPFGSLDEDLQILMERYLEERGVTQALAVFAPDYVDVKEQKEYVRWLSNVKGFISA